MFGQSIRGPHPYLGDNIDFALSTLLFLNNVLRITVDDPMLNINCLFGHSIASNHPDAHYGKRMKTHPIQPVPSDIALGRRLRAVRERRHFTLEQVAERTVFSKGFISRVERDLTSPSVQSLVTLCQVLGINPGQLLDAPEVSVVEFASAPRVDLGGAGIVERLITPPTQRDIQIIHMTVDGHGHGEEEPYTMNCT